MEIISINVSQLKCACLDKAWRKRWMEGENPSTKQCGPPGELVVGGTAFHNIVEGFVTWLAHSSPKNTPVSEETLWKELYKRFAEPSINTFTEQGKIETALYLSASLRAFCRRLAGLHKECPKFQQWSDVLLTQEYKVKDVHFPLGKRSIFISGVMDLLRLHPKKGFQIVDYKLSRAANLRHDLLQLAIYGRLLARTQPQLAFSAVIEYYLPELDVLEVSVKDLEGIFDDLVLPVMEEMAGGAPQRKTESAQTASQPSPATAPSSSQSNRGHSLGSGYGAHDDTAEKITTCFQSFGLSVVVTGVQEGPQLMRYTVKPASGVRVISLSNRAEDLQVALGLAQVPLIEPSASGVAIDIPKDKAETVQWHEVITRVPLGPVAFPIGVAVDGSVLVADLSDASTCHALVAGASGSGKSEWLKNVVASLIHKNGPGELRLALIDPKLLTFAGAEASLHLLCPVITEIGTALEFLKESVKEMDRRYQVLAREHLPNLRERHEAGRKDIPFWVLVFDEFADLILAGREEKKAFETAVSRLAGKGRAAGIHLILATQRPDRNIVTGIIKANLPLKVCLRVTNSTNSQIVLDEPGGEKLLGRGDLLCDLGRGVQRAQAPFVTGEEFRKLLS